MRGREVVVVEAAGAVGMETSSRHSEGELGRWRGGAVGGPPCAGRLWDQVSYGFILLRRSAEPAHSMEALKGTSRQGSGPQLGHAP